MGGLQAKSMTSQRYRATYKMADMRYYGNVMTTTRWQLYVIVHLQQYSRRLNLFVIYGEDAVDINIVPLWVRKSQDSGGNLVLNDKPQSIRPVSATHNLNRQKFD